MCILHIAFDFVDCMVLTGMLPSKVSMFKKKRIIKKWIPDWIASRSF